MESIPGWSLIPVGNPQRYPKEPRSPLLRFNTQVTKQFLAYADQVEIINNFKKDSTTCLANDSAETNDADKYLLEHSGRQMKRSAEILKLKELSSRISVVAIGGFGREQLFPTRILTFSFTPG